VKDDENDGNEGDHDDDDLDSDSDYEQLQQADEFVAPPTLGSNERPSLPSAAASTTQLSPHFESTLQSRPAADLAQVAAKQTKP